MQYCQSTQSQIKADYPELKIADACPGCGEKICFHYQTADTAGAPIVLCLILAIIVYVSPIGATTHDELLLYYIFSSLALLVESQDRLPFNLFL
jgi:uncharacterized protein (DUF983 family)